MNQNKRKNRINTIVTLLMAVLAACFISLMGYLNYKTTLLELKELVINRIEADTVDKMETALKFGKRIDNFYGTDDIFSDFRTQITDSVPFIVSKDGKLMYDDSANTDSEAGRIGNLLNSTEYGVATKSFGAESITVGVGGDRCILYPIYQDDEIAAYFACIFASSDITVDKAGIRDNIIIQTVLVAIAMSIGLILALLFFARSQALKRFSAKRVESFKNLVIVTIIASGIVVLAVFSIFAYRIDYRTRVKDATRMSVRNIETTLSSVSDKGVNIRNVEGLEDYISSRVSGLETLRSVRISDHIAEVDRLNEVSDLVSFAFETGVEKGEQTYLYLEAEISSAALSKQIRSIVLTLISTLVILLMFVLESTNLIELISQEKSAESEFSEKKVAMSLRLTGFLCSTAEYMCVPYAAMMIRETGERLFGLSNGVTAALPLTLEGFAQMIGMLLLPKLVKKVNVRNTLIVSSILMVACNGLAFLSHAALTIVLCRTFAGFAYAGFKQISNYLITRGYNTESGRSDNISQDNAGLLAGATCGAGLGAILSANLGYSMNFLISAGFFVLYMLATLFAVPWNMLKVRSHMEEESKPVSASGIRRMIFSKEMLFFVLAIGIPLNIGVMLCVTLIPAICQTNGISSVMLSYCYIANGIAGIYIGPALVSKAKKRFGLPLCIAFAFALTAVSLFVLHIPPVIVMIVVASMVLGFLDGFGTPMVTDQFMELKVVRNEVDESTALIFSVVLSYILLTFAPMIAELLLLPGKGFFNPMMIGMLVYAACAVVLVFYRLGKRKES